MAVLRTHASSLMAMLEAFIHDPLIKWRLLQPGLPAIDARGGRSRSGPSASSGATITAATAAATAAGGGALAGGQAAGTGGACGAAGGPATGRREAGKADAGKSVTPSRSRRDSLNPSLRASIEESLGYNSADPLHISQPGAHTPLESMRQRQRSMSEVLEVRYMHACVVCMHMRMHTAQRQRSMSVQRSMSKVRRLPAAHTVHAYPPMSMHSAHEWSSCIVYGTGTGVAPPFNEGEDAQPSPESLPFTLNPNAGACRRRALNAQRRPVGGAQ